MVSKDEMLKWMDGVRPEYREPEYDAIRALIDAPSKPRVKRDWIKQFVVTLYETPRDVMPQMAEAWFRAVGVEVEDMHAKLKPCPWCRNEKVTAKEELPGYWYIECWSCGASGPVYPHKDTAVSAWNRRKGETDAD